MTTPFARSFAARAMLALLFVCAGGGAVPLSARAADALPLAGDDTFQVGPLDVRDGGSATVVVDRAYGPLEGDAGRLAPHLIGGTVAATADLEVAPANGDLPPAFAVAVNGTPVAGAWEQGATPGVYRLAVPTDALRFPAPGAADAPLVPRPNALAFSGGEASLRWLRLVVPGAPPVLYMAGADTNCGAPGVQPVAESFGDWARWLAADGVPFAAPDRDGHLSIAEQLRYIDDGYAQLRNRYGPNRPDVSPRVTLVGYSMGGLVARQWAAMHPGLAVNFVTISTPNDGTAAVTSILARFASECAGGVLHDLAPAAAAAFNATYDLSAYWSPAAPRVVSVAAVPAQGERTDGVVTEASALALPYAQHIVWSPAPGTRLLRPLHNLVMHAEPVYHDVRAATHLNVPQRDGRTG